MANVFKKRLDKSPVKAKKYRKLSPTYTLTFPLTQNMVAIRMISYCICCGFYPRNRLKTRHVRT